MAAVPQNNLREQLQRHSARGALRAPAPPRDRPPLVPRAGSGAGRLQRPGSDGGSSHCRGFTFKKAPRGLAAASVLRDKDVNTSLALPASALPDKKAPAWGCVPSRSSGPQPAGAPRAPAAAPEASKGPAVPGARAGSAVPARKAGPGSAADPCIIIGDEWDDIDDFDLSGIEKKFSRPPVLSPKGLRAPRDRKSVV